MSPGDLSKLLLFGRYAASFERAFHTHRWGAVGRCFHREGSYVMHGLPPFDGRFEGRAAVVAWFEEVLERFDRRFDRRIPRLRSRPRVRDGVLRFDWQVDHVLGDEGFLLLGSSTCRFRGTRIWELTDALEPEGCALAVEWLRRFEG